ncbi:MAG: pilus assembly protein N-terminal domain-containing protein [Hyphomicrobiales bacterium]
MSKRPITQACLALLLLATPAAASDIEVRIDEATLVRLAKPAGEVIVGNPSVADVTVQSSGMLVITGKSFGMTNMIVLDAKGTEILNKKLVVQSDPARYVSLQRGSARQSYACGAKCEPALMPGDSDVYMEQISKGLRSKFGVVQSVVEGGQPAQ